MKMRQQRNGGRAPSRSCHLSPGALAPRGRGVGARVSPFVLGMRRAAHGGRPSARVAEDRPGGAEREEGGQPWGLARWPPTQPGPPVRCWLLHTG